MLYKNIVRPILFRLTRKDPEVAHEWAIDLLRAIGESKHVYRELKKYATVNDPRLSQKVFDLEFKNPVGLAAGFDKNGEVIDGLSALGFGFIEVGTITPYYQKGNDRPRMFRIPEDEALINRMGFNNVGADNVIRCIFILRKSTETLLGISIGKSKTTPLEKAADDYIYALRRLYDFGHYVVINISSPNTPGLRQLQDKQHFDQLLERINKEIVRLSMVYKNSPKPLLVKIAPDISLDALDDVLEICERRSIGGIIAVNTTVSRDGLQTRGPTIEEAGGLSGRPLKMRSLEILRHIYSRTEGNLPIIGVGGIFSAEDAYEMFKAGASLIQVFTGMIYEGPFIARNINRGLLKIFEREGIKHISEINGRPSHKAMEAKGGKRNEKIGKCFIVRRQGCQPHY